jgi:hypothetical protein
MLNPNGTFAMGALAVVRPRMLISHGVAHDRPTGPGDCDRQAA